MAILRTTSIEKGETMSSKAKKEWIGGLVLFLLVSFVSITFAGYHTVKAAVDQTYVPLEHGNKTHVNLKKGQPFSLLLIQENHQNTSFVYMTVNKQHESIKMTHLPGSTQLGNETLRTIYHQGNMNAVIKKVEAYAKLPVDYYVKMDQQSVVDAVDKLGGIIVTNKRAFEHSNIVFPKGSIRLNGKEALVFLKERNEQDIFTAHERQLSVAKAIFSQAATIPNVTKLHSLVFTLADHIETNATFNDINRIQKTYKPAVSHVDKQQFPQNEWNQKQVTTRLHKHLEREELFL